MRPLISGLIGIVTIPNTTSARNGTAGTVGWDIYCLAVSPAKNSATARQTREARTTMRKRTKKTKKMPLAGHLVELRRRIIYCLVAVVVCVVVAYIFRHYVFVVLMHPLQGSPVNKLTTLGVTEAFMQVLKVSVYVGIAASLPIILYHFWAFVMPALYEHERRSSILYSLATTVLFLGGAVFAYFVVLPVGLRFLVGYGGEDFSPILQAERYVSFVARFLLAFGLVFELPLFMLILAWAGIVDHTRMRKIRKYAIVAEALVAMIITPGGDPFSMMLMLVPLMLLYELGIWLARWAGKRKARRKQLPSAS
jgi:sec-independent protein translocase protein TatC